MIAVRIHVISDVAPNFRDALKAALGVDGFHEQAENLWVATIFTDGRSAEEVVTWVREQIAKHGLDEHFRV